MQCATRSVCLGLGVQGACRVCRVCAGCVQGVRRVCGVCDQECASWVWVSEIRPAYGSFPVGT